MKHKWVEHKNCTCPSTCPICNGGLAVCEVCGLFEGALTTDCPGYQCCAEKSDSVYQGKVDFVNGEWVDQPSPHSPASQDPLSPKNAMDLLDKAITRAINNLIVSHELHPQEAADVLVQQTIDVLDALQWKPGNLQAAKKSLQEAAYHLSR